MDNVYKEKILERMEVELSCSAHNVDHVMRVYNLCILIAESEDDVNMDILEPAALLHDIARAIESDDKSGNSDHAILGSDMAGEFLESIGYQQKLIDDIKHCITTHRYRTNNTPKTIEAKILFDADKLDAIGAIGIARNFMMAGQCGQRINPQYTEESIKSNTTNNGRIKDVTKHSPIIEYERKLKKVTSKLFTKKGNDIGQDRLEHMEKYFSRLYFEMAGEC